MSVHLYARDEKGLRSRWYARFVPLGAYAGKDGAFLSNCCGAETASPLAQKQVDAAGGQWSVCGVRRWGEKGRIIAANKAYLPDFFGNLVVDKRAVVGTARYSAGWWIRICI